MELPQKLPEHLLEKELLARPNLSLADAYAVFLAYPEIKVFSEKDFWKRLAETKYSNVAHFVKQYATVELNTFYSSLAELFYEIEQRLNSDYIVIEAHGGHGGNLPGIIKNIVSSDFLNIIITKTISKKYVIIAPGGYNMYNDIIDDAELIFILIAIASILVRDRIDYTGIDSLDELALMIKYK